MAGGSAKYNDVKNVGYTVYEEGMDVGYRFFDKPGSPTVSFPFGFGLSYTTFEVSEPVYAGDQVSVTITNIGKVAGKEVVIVKDPVLRAFGKTRLLQPGESQTLNLIIQDYETRTYQSGQQLP